MDSPRAGHLVDVSLLAQQGDSLPDLRFRSVYETYAPSVWNYLRRHGIAAADIEDVVHEVFVVVHQKLAQFDGSAPAALRAWVYAIAFRVASEHRRRVSRRREIRSPHAEPMDLSAGPEDKLADREARAMLLEALSRLPDEQRQVFVLHDIEEHPMPAIAEILGDSTSTLYSRLRLARERMAKTIRQLRSKGDRP